MSLGLARGGIDAFLGGAARRDLSDGKAIDDPLLQARYARAEGEVRSARCYFFDAAQKAWLEVVERGDLAEDVLWNLNLAAVHATGAAMKALDELMDVAGMGPLYEADGLGRFWRDLRAANQHALISVMRESEIGASLLGR